VPVAVAVAVPKKVNFFFLKHERGKGRGKSLLLCYAVNEGRAINLSVRLA
jgi:hypothetical protein